MAADPKVKPRPRRVAREKGRSDAAWVEARDEWRRRAVRFGCRVCPELGETCSGPVRAHHLIYRQHLDRYVASVAHQDGLSQAERDQLELSLIWDHSNALGACERAHTRHHSRAQPIPLSLVPLAAFAFAARLGLGHRIEEAYPQ